MIRAVTALLALAAVAALIVLAAGRVAPAGRVYSVDEVQAGLRQSPGAWRGRTLLIHGWTSDVLTMNCSARLIPSTTPASSSACAVVWVLLMTHPVGEGSPTPAIFVRVPPMGSADLTRDDPLVNLGLRLRALPVVGPTLFGWGGSRTLRVTLTRSAATFCGSSFLCGQGVLAL